MNTTRRNMLKSAAFGAAAAVAQTSLGTPALAQTAGASQGGARTFVLIHGAWHGGWCWRDVASILTANGHKVYTPSLTGLAEHSHLLSPSIILETHINDVVNLFRWEDIDNAILVGHSYGGWPISGAVETIGAQVGSIVFLDAFMPEDGETGLARRSPKSQASILQARTNGDAGRAAPDPKAFVQTEAKHEWVRSKLTPQPYGVELDPIRLTGARDKIAKKVYIRTGFKNPAFDAALDKVKDDPSWQTHVLAPEESGHDVMVDAPERLAELLMQSA